MATTSTSHPRKGLTQELVSSTAFLLKRIGFEVKDRWHEEFEPLGLMPQHHAVLSLLDEGTCTAQWMIADRLDYDRSQIVGLLDDLEERGLVLRKRDPADRRRHLVTLTDDGRAKLRELGNLTKSVEKDFLAPLDAEERQHRVVLRHQARRLECLVPALLYREPEPLQQESRAGDELLGQPCPGMRCRSGSHARESVARLTVLM